MSNSDIKKKERDSNMELLRIIAMFLIVVSHYAVHGVTNTALGYAECGSYLDFFRFFGNFGVNLFVLISGFYMITQTVTPRKIFYLLFQVSFYSISLYVLASVFIYENACISLSEFLHFLFPVMYSKYWFVTTYVQLLILTPFLNSFLNRASLRMFVAFIFACILILIYFRLVNCPLLLFVSVYSIGAFVRLHRPKLLALSSKFYFFLTFSLLSVYIAVVSYSHHIFHYTHRLISLLFFSQYSLFILLLSVSCFLFFTQIRIKKVALINMVASSTLGIYLIHEHPLIRDYIWQNVFHVKDWYQSDSFYMYCLFSVISIFVCCALIDIVVNRYITRPIWQLVDMLGAILKRKLKSRVTTTSNIDGKC